MLLLQIVPLLLPNDESVLINRHLLTFHINYLENDLKTTRLITSKAWTKPRSSDWNHTANFFFENKLKTGSCRTTLHGARKKCKVRVGASLAQLVRAFGC